MRQLGTDRIDCVLVVEDDTLMRGLIIDILDEAGYATREACCAQEALDLLVSRPELAQEIAVVVTDVEMPGEIDGISLAARLLSHWPRLGIIVTSGAQSGAALALRPPAVFLPKPFRADRLVAMVTAMIERMYQAPARCAF